VNSYFARTSPQVGPYTFGVELDAAVVPNRRHRAPPIDHTLCGRFANLGVPSEAISNCVDDGKFSSLVLVSSGMPRRAMRAYAILGEPPSRLCTPVRVRARPLGRPRRRS
jgi:hypothetical protein